MTEGIWQLTATVRFNPFNAELNPICHLLTLLGAHHILHVSRVRVKLTIIQHLSFDSEKNSQPTSGQIQKVVFVFFLSVHVFKSNTLTPTPKYSTF